MDGGLNLKIDIQKANLKERNYDQPTRYWLA